MRNMDSWKVWAVVVALILGGLVGGASWPAAAQDPNGGSPAPDPVEAGGVPPAASPSEPYKAGDLLVKLRADATAAATANMPDRYGATRDRVLHGSDVELWRVPEGEELATAEELSTDPRVEYAEPNYVYHALVVPNDPNLSKQWAHTLVKSPAAWDITTGSSSVIIAIIDTGVDLGHPDLAGKLVAGYDFVDGGEPRDENGHGTHVAGIAGAVTNNGTGVAGMDWQARLMPIRALDAEGSGYVSDITEGIYWAYQHGARVLSLSLGGSGYSLTMRNAVNAAHAAGSLVVAAMGNCRTYDPLSCPLANPTIYPAAYDTVMAVAATGPTDEYAYYSQYGPHNDIAAPGGDMAGYHDPDGIYSTMPTYPVYMTTAYSYYTNYDFAQGTSQATPYVAGLAALLLGGDPSLTPDEVQNTIKSTADDLGAPGWDPDYGYGRINALAALQSVSVPVAPTLLAISNSDGDGTYLVDWNSVPNATSYVLQEDRSPAFVAPTERYRGAATQVTITGQSSGLWFYRVRASNSVGTSPWSNVQSASVAPRAPTLSPIANPSQEDQYELQWSASDGATRYSLEEAASPAFTNPKTRYAGPALSYQVTGQAGGTWYYRVRAENPATLGPWSGTQSTVVSPAALPSPSLNPIGNADGDGNYLVRWSSVSGATSYLLEESRDPYFSAPTQIYGGGDLQFSVSNHSGGTWHYRVRAVGPPGKSPWSNAQATVVDVHAYLPFIAENVGSGLAPGTLVNGDFESGGVGWIEYSFQGRSLITDRNFPSNIRPHSGRWAAWLGSDDNERAYVEQQVIVPPGKPYLAYWHWIDSQDVCPSTGFHYDLAKIMANGYVVDLYDLCAGENTGSWKQYSVDLRDYTGQAVSLRLAVETDYSLHSNLFVDDVAFQASALR